MCLNSVFVQTLTGIPLFDNHSKNYFDRKRNEFLASIYCENFRDTEKIYREISAKIEAAKEFSEVEQKAINQIQHAFRTFRKQITTNCSNDIKEVFKGTRKTIARAVRKQIKNVTYVEYDEWYAKVELSKEQFRIMLKTVATLQITVGCSISCRRCNEWALPGPRKHFSFNAVTTLIKELFEAGNNDFVLYCASDPMDWKSGGKNISDILVFMSGHGYKSQYGLLTKIPKGSEKIIASLLKAGADIGFSITDKNRSKVEKIENTVNRKLDVQHDTAELLIPAGLDEDFSNINSSITDSYGSEITPEGAFLIAPTFTSALNLTGQCRVPITADTDLFLKKRVGIEGLAVEYFKPLEAIDLKGRTLRLKKLMDAQIENIMLDNGSETLVPPGMMNMHEYFKVYAPEAVQQRKSLLRAFSKKLMRDILGEGKQPGISKEERYAHFKKRVRVYSESCRPGHVAELKRKAFSFYLKGIADYLKGHPVEREIVMYLREGDRQHYASEQSHIDEDHGQTVDALLSEFEAEPFDLFQVLIFMLLDDPDDKMIGMFLRQNPVETTDCFL